MRRMVAALVVALTLAGCSILPGDRDAPARPESQTRWRSCAPLPAERTSGRRLECATIKVPQNWAAPEAGRTFDIAMVRTRSPNQRDRIGSLVVHPETAGASGRELVGVLAGVLPDDILARFDLVGFDHRGLTGPGHLQCMFPPRLETYFGYDPDPAAKDRFDLLTWQAGQMVSDCTSAYGQRMLYYSTRQTAHDLDAVRAAVGDAKVTYLGYGYGTLLGAVYAHLFPQNIRAQVLIGALDPRTRRGHPELRVQGLERTFDAFVAWCRANPGTNPPACAIAPDARAAVASALELARTNPPKASHVQTLTPGWVLTAVAAGMHDRRSWPRLADALARMLRGDADPILEIADDFVGRDSRGRYSNEVESEFAVTCNDNLSSVDEVRKRQNEWRTKYPLFGTHAAVRGMVCASWPGNGDPYPFGGAAGAPPILVVGTRADPATPYEQAPELARTLGVGVVLGTDGSSRTVYPQSGCVSAAVTTYLLDVRPPPDGMDCRAR